MKHAGVAQRLLRTAATRPFEGSSPSPRLKGMELITASCGIGRSFEEAAKAITLAKKSKGKRKYNISVYSGKRLRSKIPLGFKKRVKKYLKLTKKLNKRDMKVLEEFSLHDPITGLLNKTGFVLRLEQLRKMKINEGYYILIDLDNLHYWNEKLGYNEVDQRIGIIGKEILKSIRHSKDRVADVLGHRLNESAGDEFLIFLPAKHTKENVLIFIKKAEEILENISKIQKEIAKIKRLTK